MLPPGEGPGGVIMAVFGVAIVVFVVGVIKLAGAFRSEPRPRGVTLPFLFFSAACLLAIHFDSAIRALSFARDEATLELDAGAAPFFELILSLFEMPAQKQNRSVRYKGVPVD